MSGRLKSVSVKRFQAVGAFGKIWKTVLATGAGAAALAAVNANIRRNAKEPEENALGGEAKWFDWREGRVFYKESGAQHKGTPLVFIHGIGAGASSFMWRKNFDALAESFHVYALDLLGFGASEKPATAPYSADLYTDLIADFIHEVAKAPADIIANSLAGAFTIRVADEHPHLVRSLILIAPTGADSLRARPGMTGAAFYGLLQSPVLGTSFYNVMSSERSIRDYARRQLFYDASRVTNRLVTQLYAASHQEGAQHAISAFLSGFLNTDIRDAFARLRQPVTLVWGKQDQMNPIEQAAALLSLNPNADMEIFDRCRMTPHEEHPEKFNAFIRRALGARSAAA
ncbi:MAG: alpha/beta fold hydrolase [Pyrinomonadaceae bacterium]|nr:alpha/beta fold hydrolase [Pyrinomonadaceae bacterium]